MEIVRKLMETSKKIEAGYPWVLFPLVVLMSLIEFWDILLPQEAVVIDLFDGINPV
jgi:hypothetical protein